MKIFVYKTLFVFLCIFVMFHFTIGSKLKQLEGQIENFQSKENIEGIKNKIRGELSNAVQKENCPDQAIRLYAGSASIASIHMEALTN